MVSILDSFRRVSTKTDQAHYRSPTTLDKPIRAVAKEAKIRKHLSARCMRRTFQDLGRAAQVHDFVVRAISGHATIDMQAQYSTVSGDEVRRGLAKVISLAGIRAKMDGSTLESAGGHAGAGAESEATG
jgi:integrase